MSDFFFQNNGITYQCTYVYTSQQNGVLECNHRHILTIARALLFQSHFVIFSNYNVMKSQTFLYECQVLNNMFKIMELFLKYYDYT
jgi:hypothetical protein